MGDPPNFSTLMTLPIGGSAPIWLIEPPQSGQPSSSHGRNKTFWIRNRPANSYLPAIAVVELRNG
jgi:hypothetical protein